MSPNSSVEVACVVGATLGEGPVWDAAAGVLWFVDIKQRQVHRFTPSTGRLDSWTAPDQVGWIFPMAGGGYLSGLKMAKRNSD